MKKAGRLIAGSLLLMSCLWVDGVRADTATLTSLPVPCEAGTTKSCQIGLRKCSLAKPDFIKTITHQMQIKIEGYYRGKDVDISSHVSTIDWANLPGISTFKPVCNLVAGEKDKTNGTPQINQGPPTNLIIPARASESCGDFVVFHQDGIDNTGTHGTREQAYRAGAWVQAVLCQQASVISEIQNGVLQVSTACSSLAADVAKFYAIARRISAENSNLCSSPDQQNIADQTTADLCDSMGGNPDAAGVSDKAKHWMSACYLANARSGIEAAFRNVAQCEIMTRAEVSFTKTFLGSDGSFTAAINALSDRCRTQAENASKSHKCFIKVGKKCVFGSDYYDSGIYFSTMNACYQKNYPNTIKTYLQTHFPSGGSCAPTGLIQGSISTDLRGESHREEA